MKTINQIHQKLETMDLTPFEAREVKSLVELSFRAGLALNASADPLEGYSNLTAAIQSGEPIAPQSLHPSGGPAAISAGEPIDWERLNGRKVQCVKPDVGTLKGKLERNESRTADYHAGWWREDADSLYRSAFIYGWTGHDGWTLWLEGDIPLCRKTADQLERGTCFRARYTKGDYAHTYSRAQVIQVNGEPRVICLNAHFSHVIATYTPAEVEVLEVYGPGTFQNPEGK